MMKELTRAELKQYQLLIIDRVHEFCVNNDMRYYLSGGSLIGAVRHNGFIPWDDDIDINMLRADYDKFVEEFNRSNEDFHAYSIKNDAGYNLHFCKICYEKSILRESELEYNDIDMGISIDLFPLDKLPPDADDGEILKKAHFYDKIMFCKAFKWQELKNRKFRQQIFILSYKLLGLLWTKKRLGEKQEQLEHLFENSDTDYYGAITCHFNKKIPRWKKDDLNILEHEFEGRYLFVPSGYHKILSDQFGDYMSLPPAEEQKPKHGFLAYIKE